MSNRRTQLFFFGALCWKTDQITHNEAELKRKCDRSYSQSGFLSRYSFGLRYDIFTRFHSKPGYRLFATDFTPSMPRSRVQVDREILGSVFCLCPSGTGWGMRVFHVLVLGCIPVLTQDDGEHPKVAQAFEPEVLDWSEFAVVVPRAKIPQLDTVLASVDIAAKRQALRKVWTRIVWRDTLPRALAERLPGPDAFETLLAAISKRLDGANRTSRRQR
uniref:Exostosin GT47 domain-containing protein n=1 Tax=Haptolina ericina TaxID=156174 RepID=A0A7S3C275_9EUKA